MLEQVMAVAVIIIVGMLGFILRGFLNSYFTEKGKSLATKQDIEQITSQVETVKASIQTLAQLQTDYEQQRRKWLLSFYDSAVEMLYDKLAIDFGELPFDDGRSLFEFQQSFRSLVASLLKQYQRIVIYFCHEDPLRASAERVVNHALEAQSVLKNRLGRVKRALLEEEEALKLDNREQYHEAVNNTNGAVQAYGDEMSPIIENLVAATRIYLTHLNEFLRKTTT